MSDGRIVVVTGASRGIGREVVRVLARRGDTVVLGARNVDAGRAVAGEMGEARANLHPVNLDVTDPEGLSRLAESLHESLGRVDALVNNAAINYDTWQSAVDADLDVVRETLETNLLGAWQVTQALLPLLRKSAHGRIVNVSSESGSLSAMGGGTPAYAVSKAALNALTRMLAAELRRDRILVNAVCPGWVSTDMGGPGGRPVGEGAASVIWAVDLPDDGPTGGFYQDGVSLPW